MKGYKVFYHDLTCRPTPEIRFYYEVGETYEMDEPPVICQRGFHFWKFPHDVFNLHTPSFDARVCEVEATGKIVTDGAKSPKYATNCIRIVYELCPAEIAALMAGPVLPGSAAEYAGSTFMADVARQVRLYLDSGENFVLTGWDLVSDLSVKQKEFIDSRAHEWKAVLEAKGYEV